MVLNGSRSTWEHVLSGVPQGSVLGPVLFLIFINDLGNGLESLLSVFADDTKLYSRIKDGTCGAALQRSIDKLNEWAHKWQMSFNGEKCSVMHLGKNNPRIQYFLGDQLLHVYTEEKDIGVVIQANGKYDIQCKNVAKTCNRIIGQVSRSFTNRDQVLMLQIYKVYILPHIEYGMPLWGPCLQKDLKILEAVQRRFTRLIPELKNLPYVQRLVHLNLPSIELRRRQNDLVQAYRIWTGIDKVQGNFFTKVSDMHSVNTRNATKDNFTLPKPRLKPRQDFFTLRVIHDWNSLPQDIQRAPNVKLFKKKMKSFIF